MKRVHRSSLVAVAWAVCLSLALCVPAEETVAPTAESFGKNLQPFLAEHCTSCHNARKQSGKLNLEQFKSAEGVLQHRDVFELVLRRIEKGEMPPAKQPRPDPKATQAAIDWLDGAFEHLDGAAKPNPGRVTVRRLNRTEYNNTVRELLGVDIQPADDFPHDDTGYGFDNIGDVLSMSPMLMEKYLKAAEKVARAALYGPERLKSTSFTHQPWYIDFNNSKKIPAEYDETGMSMPYSAHAVHRFPVEGEYEITGWVRGFRPAGCDPIRIGFWVDGKMVHEGAIPVLHDEGELNGLSTSCKTRVTAGDHWLSVTILSIYEGLPPAYGGPKPNKSDARVGKAPTEFFAQNIRIVGPLVQTTGPSQESLKKIYVCGHLDGKHDADCARKIVANLAHRAFRRPATAQETDALLGLANLARQEGDSFEEGICLAIEKILISPHFLFRMEADPAGFGGEAHPVSQHELATRLSYFLWSSMPDDDLLQLADAGKLDTPEAIDAQVRRMLKDPKSHELVLNFGGQWLQFRGLESHSLERKKFQQYTDYTRMSMEQETALFFDHIIQEDRSVLDFIDADYSYLNQRLAEFYGIAGVKGHEFRKVALPPESHRSGVVTQASVLTVSSYATRTSPVIRGKWILENMLNAAPPPPPANVPSLKDSEIGSTATMREQLSKHRADATCASCHSRMDPLGFSLENFDAIGAWREKDGKMEIDASGELPDGKTFKGPDELKTILRADKDAFAECIADKMLTYALGRGLAGGDRSALKKIARQLAKEDYRFSSLVLGIVRSPQFQLRQASPETP